MKNQVGFGEQLVIIDKRLIFYTNYFWGYFIVDEIH